MGRGGVVEIDGRRHVVRGNSISQLKIYLRENRRENICTRIKLTVDLHPAMTGVSDATIQTGYTSKHQYIIFFRWKRNSTHFSRKISGDEQKKKCLKNVHRTRKYMS